MPSNVALSPGSHAQFAFLIGGPGIFSHVHIMCRYVGTNQKTIVFTGDIVSAFSLWYKQAPKSSSAEAEEVGQGQPTIG